MTDYSHEQRLVPLSEHQIQQLAYLVDTHPERESGIDIIIDLVQEWKANRNPTVQQPTQIDTED